MEDKFSEEDDWEKYEVVTRVEMVTRVELGVVRHTVDTVTKSYDLADLVTERIATTELSDAAQTHTDHAHNLMDVLDNVVNDTIDDGDSGNISNDLFDGFTNISVHLNSIGKMNDSTNYSVKDEEVNEDKLGKLIYSDTLILIVSLVVMIIVALILRSLCLKLTVIKERKSKMRGGIRQIATHMDLVTKSMSNDLFIPDSPQSVIRTYSKYNSKSLPVDPDSPPSSPGIHHSSPQTHPQTPPHSPTLLNHQHSLMTLQPPTPQQSPMSSRKCVMSSELRLQALGNSFLQTSQESNRGRDRGRRRDRAEEEFIMGRIERVR